MENDKATPGQPVISKADAIRKAPTTNSRAIVCNEFRPDDWPEEDFELYVKSLDGPNRLKMERQAGKGRYKKQPDELRRLLLTKCVFDDPEFQTATFAGFSVEEITNLNPVPRERLFDAALTLSGLSNKEIDDLVGN